MVRVEEAQANNSLMDDFINENMGLVRTAIKKLGLNPFDDDYLQEGCIGLVKAVKKYNPEFGVAFSSYAVSMIQGKVQQYRRDYESANLTGVRVSRGIKDIFFRTKTLSDKGMSDEEICKQLGISLEKLNNARIAMQHCASLDAEFDENEKGEEGKNLHDIISSDSGFEEEAVERICRHDFLDQLFECLSEKQASVLLLHLKGFNQRSIGQKLGLSQVDVSRSLKKIIEKGKQIAKGEILMKAKITEEQLLAECREHGTSKEALDAIAVKYGMTPGSLRFKLYHWRINDRLNAEKASEKALVPAKSVVKEIPLPNPEVPVPKKISTLKVKAWDGKECTYTFQDGKLVITSKNGVLEVEDYKTMLQEIQELISIREAG